MKTIRNPIDIMQGLNEERGAGRLCDVVFTVGGKRFQCHRNVLTTASTYFNIMFGDNFKETSQPEIVLHGVDPDGFRMMLNFMYLGKVDLDIDNLKDVMGLTSVSEYIGIETVLNECVDYLKENINIIRACQMAVYFTDYRNDELLAYVTSLLMKEFSMVKSTKHFMMLPYSVFKDIIFDDNTIIYGEDEIVETILKWVEFNPQERNVYRNDLAGGIRHQYITDDYKEYAQAHPDINNLLELAAIQCAESNAMCRIRKRIYMFGLSRHENDQHWVLDAIRYNGSQAEKLCRMSLNLPHRCYNRMVISDSHIYKFSTIPCISKNTFQYYNQIKGLWVPMNTPFKYIPAFDMASMNDSIYVNTAAQPGYHEKAGFGIYSYSKHTDRWFSLPARPVLAQRTNASSLIADNGVLYVCGGLTVRNRACSSVCRYDPRVGSWQQLRSMNKMRAYGAGVADNGTVYFAGGIAVLYSDAEVDEVPVYRHLMQYNPRRDVWHVSKSMINPRHSHSLIFNDNKLWAVGGGAKAAFMESYDPAVNTWSAELNTDNYFQKSVTGVCF